MFVSYAQNFEDVLLWRALNHVGRGFYIDIGAHDPDVDSVSRAFYDHGWRGVHVEPVGRYAESLRAARPDEEVIEAAIATTEGTISFFDIPETGLSTGKAEIAAQHEREGLEARQIEVASMRLATLLDRHAERDIHWLKIDVEEMERDVLESWSPSPVRPWIVVIESTVPRSPEPNHFGWEPLLLAMDYEFAHFDGLNRFYVHQSRAQLKDKLQLGPNLFDAFVIDRQSYYARNLNSQIEQLTQQVEAVEAAARAEKTSFMQATQSWHNASTAIAGELALKNETIAAHAQQIAALRAELAVQEMASGAHRAEVEQLHARILETNATHTHHIAALQAELTALQTNVAASDAAVAEHVAEAEHLRQRLAAAEAAHAQERTALQQESSAIQRELTAIQADLGARDERLAELSQARDLATRQRDALGQEVAALRASMSWRITGPLRAASRGARWLWRGPRWFAHGVWAWLTLKPGSRPRRIARAALMRIARFISRRPGLYRAALRVVRMLPFPVQQRLQSIVMAGASASYTRIARPPIAEDVSELSARAREIYVLLLAERSARKAD